MRSYRYLGVSFSLALISACGAGSSNAPASTTGAWSAEEPPPPLQVDIIQPMPVQPATTPAAPNINPFENAQFYVDPVYVKKVQSSIDQAPDKAAQLKKLQSVPTALWIDRIEMVAQVPVWLEDAAKKEKAAGKPVVPVFVVYDLPNRDCAAKSSNGELAAAEGGEQRYRTEFIDKIAEHFAAHPNQRIVAILEPDSLPNVATNLNVPHCAASQELYKNSVAYAISKLSLPNVHLYMDAAHAGWLGWDGNRNTIAKIFKEVLDMAGGPDRIRGFATNVSNYNALDGDWGKKLEPSNPCPNEHTYVEKLAETLTQHGIANKGFIIDTSRNGVAEARTKWGHWCNVKGAGLGERPRVSPKPLIDAYYWVKPPGDSDGVSDPNAPRFDEMCQSPDSAQNAPQAGHWFHDYLIGAMERANPPL